MVECRVAACRQCLAWAVACGGWPVAWNSSTPGPRPHSWPVLLPPSTLPLASLRPLWSDPAAAVPTAAAAAAVPPSRAAALPLMAQVNAQVVLVSLGPCSAYAPHYQTDAGEMLYVRTGEHLC